MAIRLKQSDSPTITHTFVDTDDQAIDLSANGPYGAPNSVRVYIETTNGSLIVNEAATIEDASAGELSYDLKTDETPDTGLYNVEWEADFGTVDNRELMLTSPPQGYQKIGVDRTLGTVNAGTLSKRTLTSSVNADGFDITDVNILEASTLQSADTGDSADVDSIISASGDGTAVALDLGNDNTIESSAITEIATTNDANNIATEPSPGKLLMDMGINWPTADSVATDGVDSSAIAANAVGSSELANASVVPDSLDSTNSPTDGQVPSYDSNSDTFSWEDNAGGGGSATKTYTINATTWGTNSGALQAVQVIPSALISEVTALYSTLYDSNGNIGGTNGTFKIRIYDGQANVGSTDTNTFVRWNAGERFTSSPPYLTLSSGNDAVVAVENDTGSSKRVSFGFEYE